MAPVFHTTKTTAAYLQNSFTKEALIALMSTFIMSRMDTEATFGKQFKFLILNVA